MEEKTIWLIAAGSVFAVLLICYIVALILSKRDEMVFTANGWDMGLLLACPILILVGSCAMENPSLDIFRYVVWGVAGACLIGTITFSIVTNKDSFWKKLCSIFAKIFAVWLTMFVIMLLLAILIFYIITFFARDRSEDDEFILLKYDRLLKNYVGYRVRMK